MYIEALMTDFLPINDKNLNSEIETYTPSL